MSTHEGVEPFFVGIDLGGSLLNAALVDARGKVLDESHVEAERRDAKTLLDQMAELVRDLAGRVRTVEAVGIGVPGLVNHRTKRIETLSVAPALRGIDLTSEVLAKTGLPAVLDNSANAAAYAELQMGAARGRRDVFFVMLGDTVGAGIIIGGHVYRGATGFAGEFGHITIDPEGIECTCGNIGCLETFASEPNIVRRTRERLKRDRTSSLSRLAVPKDREFTAEDIAHAARHRDEMAQLMMERTGRFLGIGLAAVINLLNVELIVLAGPVTEAGDLIVTPTVNEIRRRAFPPSFESCQVLVAELGRSAPCIGAGLLARDREDE